jgi:hypothetical protein
VRRLEQAQQRRRLLGEGGLRTEVFARQVGEAEFVLRRELPGQLQLDAGGQRLRLAQQLLGLGLVELQQDVAGLDLDPLAAFQLHLRGRIRLGQDPTGQELAGIFKQHEHGGLSHAGAAP